LLEGKNNDELVVLGTTGVLSVDEEFELCDDLRAASCHCWAETEDFSADGNSRSKLDISGNRGERRLPKL